MPPTTKDSDTAAASQENARSGSTTASAADSAAKPQPIALEVPITVNGARTIAGSDKREPFSESTKTVMVHGSGGVIRLNSSMSPGQLLFLTNERTKKEVVCQVVKSKNYRNVSGYLELEFTEPAVGFWGMRFPGDRIGPGPQATPAATPPAAAGNGALAETRPAAQKTEPPTPNVSTIVPVKPSASVPVSKPAPPAAAPSFVPAPMDSATLLGSPKPKANPGVPAAPVVSSLDADEPLIEPWLRKREPAPRPLATPPRVASPEPRAKSEEPETNLSSPVRNFELARPSDRPASLFAPPAGPTNPLNVDLSSIAPFFEVKPGPTENAPAPLQATEPPQAPAVDDWEAEELKQHTARLQEELSKMQLAESTASKPVEPEVETTSFPLNEQTISTLKAELMTEAVHASAVRLVEQAEPSEEASVLAETRKLEEPLKVEPPAAVPTPGFLEQEEMEIPAWLAPLARNASAPSSTQELVLREKARRIAEQTPVRELMAPLAPPVGETRVAESRVPQFGSARPFDEGVKARKESAPRKSGKGMLFTGLAAGMLLLTGGGWWYTNQQAAGFPSSAGAARAAVSAPSQDLPTSTVKESMTAVPGRTDSGAVNSQAEISSVASAAPDAEPVQEKKPVLGAVHLAAPKVSQKRTFQGGAEPDEEILNQDQPESSVDSLGTGLGMTSNQPAAPTSPVAVGGEVKQAKLISSVPPLYPARAKAQHISGGVTIDALIDDSGRVTKMKVISGPTLLHQAAMEALRQWKYQPAMLDGKAVPMHLTVTIQFRLQQ